MCEMRWRVWTPSSRLCTGEWHCYAAPKGRAGDRDMWRVGAAVRKCGGNQGTMDYERYYACNAPS